MKALCFLLLAAGFFLSGCGSKEKPGPQSTNTAAASGNPVTAPVDYLGAVAKAKAQTEKTLDTAGLKQAIQLFQAQEGRYPKTLNELVGPDYLRKLPEPPAGMKFDYNPKTGEVRVVPQ